jgi:hypothetical protein
MYPGVGDNAALAELARRQAGVVHRDQLRQVAVDPAVVRAHLAAMRWTAIGQNLVFLQNGNTWHRPQLMWAAVLEAGQPCALGAYTSLELVGFESRAREAQQVHLIIPRGSRPIRLPGVTVHESRRLKPEHIEYDRGLPRTSAPRSVIDAAAWQPWPRFACTLLAMAVQQRICSPVELDHAMQYVGRVRHKPYLRLALVDIAAGAQSLGEIDFARVCRRFGLALPDRQRRRQDRAGKWRYLDCEWDLATGERVVLEIDGRHHLEVEHWEADMRRERSIVVSRRWVLRATVLEVRLEPEPLVTDLLAMGVPGTTPTCQKLRSL